MSDPLPSYTMPTLSRSTEEILRRVSANSAAAAGLAASGLAGPPGSSSQPALTHVVRQSVLQNMMTSRDLPPTPLPRNNGRRSAGRGPALTSGTPAGSASATPTRNSEVQSRPGPGRPRGRAGRKRRRMSEKSESESEDEASDSSTFTPSTHKTKSGRRIQKPALFQPSTRPVRRRGPYRRVHEASVCKTCGRGISPAHNSIVFCDGCNSPYHQSCHTPRIDDEVVEKEEAEWFCSECRPPPVDQQQEQSSSHSRLANGNSIDASANGDLTSTRDPIPAKGISEDRQRGYLSTLPASTLVELVLKFATLNPDTPVFPAELLEDKYANGTSSNKDGDYENGGYDDTFYPRPGDGVRLPPEIEDISWLVDDDLVAFSHAFAGASSEMIGEPMEVA